MERIRHLTTTGSVETSNTGTAYVNLGGLAAHQVLIINRSGTELDVRTANSATAVPLANGASLALGVSASTAEVLVRRTDLNTTPATVHFVAHLLLS